MLGRHLSLKLNADRASAPSKVNRPRIKMLELLHLLWDEEGEDNPNDRFLKLVFLKTLALATFFATPVKRPLFFLHGQSTPISLTVTLPLVGRCPFDFKTQIHVQANSKELADWTKTY